MSAWRISKEDILYVLQAYCRLGHNDRNLYIRHEGRSYQFDLHNEEDFAQLYREIDLANIKSLTARYGEDWEANAPHWFWAEDFYREFRITPVQALKLCDCIDYQNCEVKGYSQSFCAHLLDIIRSRCISALPGHEEAQWGI